MLNVSSLAICALLTLLHAAGLPAFAASAPLRISHRPNSLLERNVAHGLQCRVLLVKEGWKGRFASSSLLQVKVGLAGAMGEWKIDKFCLSFCQSLP